MFFSWMVSLFHLMISYFDVILDCCVILLDIYFYTFEDYRIVKHFVNSSTRYFKRWTAILFHGNLFNGFRRTVQHSFLQSIFAIMLHFAYIFLKCDIFLLCWFQPPNLIHISVTSYNSPTLLILILFSLLLREDPVLIQTLNLNLVNMRCNTYLNVYVINTIFSMFLLITNKALNCTYSFSRGLL